MKTNNLKRQIYVSLFLLVAACTAQGVFAQNIVEIFGKEKFEKTEEGEVFYKFDKGLALPASASQGTIFNAQDIVAWMYATGNFNTPQAGDTVTHVYPSVGPRPEGEPQMRNRLAAWMQERGITLLPQWRWSEVEADSTGKFLHTSYRSAFLYTNYEAPREQICLLETSGGTRVYANGFPHEGDHYDFGYTLIPIKLKKGLNEFIYTPGRAGNLTSKLVQPNKPVMFTKRDMTVPDIIIGEKDAKWAAIRVINATEKTLKDMTIRATLESGETAEYKTDEMMPLSVRKLKYQLPAGDSDEANNKTKVSLELLDKNGKIIDQTEIEIRTISASRHHERTFISRVDGSVQYYSVAPAIRNNPDETKAMILTVHGAGVEARNQARAYKSKDWVDIIAATNRRPYGYNWEDWGRIDGLEVLEEAKRVFKPYESKIYLTGHSMGGHGTWVLGTTYPDKFAAIAPCASYPDIMSYGSGRGPNSAVAENPFYKNIERSANAGRILTLIHNLKQSGVYIFHGDQDRVVPTEQARRMRKVLGEFHPNFCYYEYPGGEHWFGESVDWHPIFEFFARQSIPSNKDVKEIDFHTATPSVSASDYWIRVEQQLLPFEFTNIVANWKNDTITVEKADNVSIVEFDIPSLESEKEQVAITISDQTIEVPAAKKAILEFDNGDWNVVESINPNHKYSARYGGFKNAFDNRMVFVYATKGNKEENEWYRNKARFDAETFYYRGNSSIDIIPDTEFSLAKYADRNIILYGNKNNNRAWDLLLKNCPIQVSKNEIIAGGKTFKGDDLTAYFVYPNPTNSTTSVGVVAGTGIPGMRATSPNNYLSGNTGFPDYMIFRTNLLRDGLPAMETTGFFNNDWSLEL